MKRLFKSFVALLAIAATAIGPAWGQNASPDVTLDFTTNTWGFPAGKTNITYAANSYTSGGYTITLQGGGSSSNGYYFNSGYLMLGKTDAYLQLPAFSSPVEKIEVVGNSAASPQVEQNVFVDENNSWVAVSTSTTGATGTNTYVINESYRATGKVYFIKVGSNHNTQITYIKVYYVSSGGGSTPEPPTPGQNSNVSWVLTPYGDLQTGDTVVIVDKTYERAMTNNNGSFSAPSADAIGLSGDQNALSDAPAATLQWVVERDNGNYMFKVPGTSNYLYCTTDNDGARVGSGNKSFEFQIGGTYNVPFLKNNATTRYLGLTNAYLWRCPSSISGSSIKDNVISFYKKTVIIIPTYTVRMAEGTEDAANWSIASGNASVTGTQVLENVMSGSQVTATYNGTTKKVKSVKAVKYVPPAATVTTAPTATEAIIEAGSTAALVNAGAANGGTMMYAVTTTNVQPASTADFSATRPTAEGRTAGTYYVWYYAKADADHSDSEIAGPVSVTLVVITTVTWNSSNISDLSVSGTYQSYTMEGITLSANADQNYAEWMDFDFGEESMNGIVFQMNESGGYTFTAPTGKKFIKIEMTPNGPGGWDIASLGTGWAYAGDSDPMTMDMICKVTWKGSAASTVGLLTGAGHFGGEQVKSIVFTLIDAQ